VHFVRQPNFPECPFSQLCIFFFPLYQTSGQRPNMSGHRADMLGSCLLLLLLLLLLLVVVVVVVIVVVVVPMQCSTEYF